jgi:hypothetical protein
VILEGGDSGVFALTYMYIPYMPSLEKLKTISTNLELHQVGLHETVCHLPNLLSLILCFRG